MKHFLFSYTCFWKENWMTKRYSDQESNLNTSPRLRTGFLPDAREIDLSRQRCFLTIPRCFTTSSNYIFSFHCYYWETISSGAITEARTTMNTFLCLMIGQLVQQPLESDLCSLTSAMGGSYEHLRVHVDQRTWISSLNNTYMPSYVWLCKLNMHKFMSFVSYSRQDSWWKFASN